MVLSLVNTIVISLLVVSVSWSSLPMAQELLNQDTIADKYEKWMALHGRTYRDNSEKEKRFQIFKNNLERIHNFNNASNRSYKLGLNQFADLTDEEFRATYTVSNMPALPTTDDTILTDHIDDYSQDEVPESIDWREISNVVTSVKDQGSCGCCWAFSAVAAVEGIAGNGVSLSAQQLLDCVSTNKGCNGGWMDNAFKYIIKNQGIAAETHYPYKTAKQTCKKEDSVTWIGSYERVARNDEKALKGAVAQQPVSVSIDASSYKFRQYQQGVFSAQDCGIKHNHAVTLVGYGTSEKGTKYWVIKNSWGKAWGESGYMKLERDVGLHGGPCGIALYPSYPTPAG